MTFARLGRFNNTVHTSIVRWREQKYRWQERAKPILSLQPRNTTRLCPASVPFHGKENPWSEERPRRDRPAKFFGDDYAQDYNNNKNLVRTNSGCFCTKHTGVKPPDRLVCLLGRYQQVCFMAAPEGGGGSLHNTEHKNGHNM